MPITGARTGAAQRPPYAVSSARSPSEPRRTAPPRLGRSAGVRRPRDALRHRAGPRPPALQHPRTAGPGTGQRRARRRRPARPRPRSHARANAGRRPPRAAGSRCRYEPTATRRWPARSRGRHFPTAGDCCTDATRSGARRSAAPGDEFGAPVGEGEIAVTAVVEEGGRTCAPTHGGTPRRPAAPPAR